MELKGSKKKAIFQWTLRIFLTVACVGMLGFIFSNSLKTGEKSAKQSSVMVEVVQEVVSVIAPNSSIANATGEAYDRLHTWVRALAHFAEFAFFGTLLTWCVLSYTWKKEALWLSLVGVCAVPFVDETLQFFVADRGAEFHDVCVDAAGGICGMLFAVVILLIVFSIYARRREKIRRRVEKIQ
ncbi:MAG: VanZ family protein [Clostridiales bacterium]|nr:VanZ family protein [Clostridiales bacterium]